METSQRILDLEELVESVNEKIQSLSRRISNIDEEHSRMFLTTERIAERAYVFSIQYSSMEEGMGHVLKSMRKHDEDSDQLKHSVRNVEKIVERRMDIIETQFRFNMRVFQQEIRKEIQTFQEEIRKEIQNAAEKPKDSMDLPTEVPHELSKELPKELPKEKASKPKWKKMLPTVYDAQFPKL